MRRRSIDLTLVSTLVLAGGLRLVPGCAASGEPRDFAAEEEETATASTTGAGGGGAGGAGTGGLGVGGALACGLPGEDVIGAGVDAARAAALEAPAGSSAPFVFDPPSGAVLPGGWPSPRFLAHSDLLPELVRLELTIGGDTFGYVVAPSPAPAADPATPPSGSWWTVALPQDLWEAAACGAAGAPIDWRIRHLAAGDDAPAGVAQGSLRLLPGGFEPDMTYWQIAQGGAQAGQFSIERLAVASSTPQQLVEGGSGCIGCHTSSPDGQDIAYQRLGGPGWQVDVVRPQQGGPAIVSPVVTPSAAAVLAGTPFMVPTTSAAAWSDADGRWIGGVTYGESTGYAGRLALLQVDAPSAAMAIAPEVGPKGFQPALPALAPDASRLVFVATDGMADGRTLESPGHTFDLWQLPVTLAKGQAPVFGEVTPVPHASGTAEGETYPTFSRDGALLAFSRVAIGRGAYDEETAEVMVMPADGALPPVRLAANDAPTGGAVYAGLGLTSSWPRFGEQTVEAPDGTYYFVVFSSRRGPADLWKDKGGGSVPVAGRPLPRLFLTVVRRAPGGGLATFPAVLVPGQVVDAGAHTADFTVVTSVEPPNVPD